MSRAQQDTIIDDDEESCPLCIEEFDLGDKNFRPCPCGYQICQFCFNSLKNTYEKSTCPNCRRPYDEKTIQYKIPTAEDIKQDLLNKNKRQVAAKKRETEKKEVEASSRKNLAGVRVKQQNLVYIIGLVPTLKDEHRLLETLRGENYFGQYGDIDKIVVSKPKPGAVNQGIGVYVTFARKEDAALCISMVDGSQNGDRILRAQYGTTKYCSAYLRGENCTNKNCTFLHDSGEDGQNTSIQNEPSTSKRPLSNTQPLFAQSAARSTSNVVPSPPSRPLGKDEAGRKGSMDSSALPTTASWATKEMQQAVRVRRESQTASRSSPSPQVTNAKPVTASVSDKRKDSATPPIAQAAKAAIPATRASISQPSSGRSSPKPATHKKTVFEDVITSACSPDFRFVFDESSFSKEDLETINRMPPLIDPYGGAKRRAMREKQAKERANLEAEAQEKLQATANSTIDVIEDEQMAGGSLQLGGEPEDPTHSLNRAEGRAAIGRPSSQMQANTVMNDQFSNLNIDGRSLTPHQRQQLALLSSANVQQAPGLSSQTQTGFSGGGFDPADQRSNLFATQPTSYETSSAHARQSSRFSFANEAAKPTGVARYNQQQNIPSQQQQHFYPSGVQGPPPGLKNAGTPPISGGGMFAQGHGFTSNINSTFGANKDNADMFLRARSGTGAGHDGKLDLADPNILQARLHQTGAGAGPGAFGGQSQGAYNSQSNMMYGGAGYGRW